MFHWLAQTTTTAAPTTNPANIPWWAKLVQSVNPITLMILVVAVMWFFVFRGKRTQDKQRKNMLAELKKGDRVQTIGGVLGTVIEAREADVLLKVDESNNTKIRFSRSAIHRVLEDGKAIESK